METKYNIGDKVLIEGEITSINANAYDNAVQIDYDLIVRDGLGRKTLTQCEREIIGKENDGRVPIEALKDLYGRMVNKMVIIDGKSNIMDTCKALLMEVIEEYDVKEDK